MEVAGVDDLAVEDCPDDQRARELGEEPEVLALVLVTWVAEERKVEVGALDKADGSLWAALEPKQKKVDSRLFSVAALVMALSSRGVRSPG